MKPSTTIACVVVAVLATIAIEESRISKLRAEVLRLRALPSDAFDSEKENLKTPAPSVAPEEASLPSAPSPTVSPTTTPRPGERQVPSDFPDPSEEEIKETALSSYSDLHYQLGLDNRQRAYFDELIVRRATTTEDLVMQWAQADSGARPAAELAIQTAIDENDEAIRAFLNREADYETFVAYQARQPDREMLNQLALVMDLKGVALEIAKERKLIEAIYQARVAADGLDWNSPSALKAIAAGNAIERFNKEWDTQTETLKALIPGFLNEEEAEAFLSSREELKPTISDSIASVAQALSGPPE